MRVDPARIDSSLLRLRRFWPIEGDEKVAYAWSRDHNGFDVRHLVPRARYRVALAVHDAGRGTRGS